MIETDPGPGDIVLTLEAGDVTDSVTIADVAEDTLSVDVEIAVDRVRRRFGATNLQVLAKIVGICDFYFENNRIIRQANRAPQGVTCTAKVWVESDGVPQGGVPFDVQYGGCRTNAVFSTIASGVTRSTGVGEASFRFFDNRDYCVYRIVTPADTPSRRQIVYEVHTFTKQAAR